MGRTTAWDFVLPGQISPVYFVLLTFGFFWGFEILHWFWGVKSGNKITSFPEPAEGLQSTELKIINYSDGLPGILSS